MPAVRMETEPSGSLKMPNSKSGLIVILAAAVLVIVMLSFRVDTFGLALRFFFCGSLGNCVIESNMVRFLRHYRQQLIPIQSP